MFRGLPAASLMKVATLPLSSGFSASTVWPVKKESACAYAVGSQSSKSGFIESRRHLYDLDRFVEFDHHVFWRPVEQRRLVECLRRKFVELDRMQFPFSVASQQVTD